MSDIPPEKPLQQELAGKRPRRERTKKNESGELSADFAALVNTIKNQGRAYRREEQREDRGKKFREWITIGLIFCTLLAVGWQVHEMIKVYEPIRQQAEASTQQAAASEKAAEATARAADATAKAADATVKASEAATRQSEIANKQAEIAAKQAESSDKATAQAQRAWVGPKDARLETKPIAGQKNRVIAEYQNTGREPALDFVFDANPFVITLADDTNGIGAAKMLDYMQKCIKMPTRMLSGVVYPTTGGFGGGGNLGVTIDEKLIDEDVVSGKKLLIVQGCLAYQTGGIIRHSAFCFFYRAEQTDIAHLNICASGNIAD